jgi:hypothetical protein
MKLSTKPDLDLARDAWNHYWNRAAWKRPLLIPSVRKPNAPAAPAFDRYFSHVNEDYAAIRNYVDWMLDAHLFLAEHIPGYAPDLGPDQFAAWIGDGELHFAEASKETNWVEASVSDWQSAFPLVIKDDNPAWQKSIRLSRMLADHCQGRCLVGTCDLHSNADALSALRGGQNLCMDYYDCPDLVEEAMRQVRALFKPVYEKLYDAGGMAKTGTTGWIPFWCEGRYTVIQCDFICMVSPETARQFIIPALDEESTYLDHCVYHLDGPGALPHLDDILSLKGIDVIQWVSGAGQPEMHTWLDVLRKCQAAGKGLQIYGVNAEQIKQLTRELKPEGLVYCFGAESPKEVDELSSWLEKNAGVSRWL